MHSHAQKTVKYGKQYKSWKVHLEFRKYGIHHWHVTTTCDHRVLLTFIVTCSTNNNNTTICQNANNFYRLSTKPCGRCSALWLPTTAYWAILGHRAALSIIFHSMAHSHQQCTHNTKALSRTGNNSILILTYSRLMSVESQRFLRFALCFACST